MSSKIKTNSLNGCATIPYRAIRQHDSKSGAQVSNPFRTNGFRGLAIIRALIGRTGCKVINWTIVLVILILSGAYAVKCIFAASDAAMKVQADRETGLFVYHYCAHYQISPGSIVYVDGIAQLEKRITNMEDYTKLKKQIDPDQGGKLTIDSLSFIGMHNV